MRKRLFPMTECTQSSFPFPPHFSRDVVARFDGGQITTEAGALLLRPVEQRTGILRQFAACFRDYRRARPGGTQRRRVGAAARVRHRLGLRGSQRSRPVAARSLAGAALRQAGRGGRAPAAEARPGKSRGGQEHLEPAGTDAGGCQARRSLQEDRDGRGGRGWPAGGSLHPGPAATTASALFWIWMPPTIPVHGEQEGPVLSWLLRLLLLSAAVHLH